MAPAASEDLQALANQGVMPEGLGMEFVDECADFVPIAGTSSSDMNQQQIWDSIMKKGDDLKRKASEDTFAVPENKKPRRIHKSRSKRSKM